MYNKQLDTFIKVADLGSLNKAAVALYISPTAIMKQINSLEQQINLKLFYRTNKGYLLTEEGKMFYHEAKKIISFSNKTINKIQKYSKEKKFILRIGSSFLNPYNELLEILKKYNLEDYYKIKIYPFNDDATNVLSIIDSLGTHFDFIIGTCESKRWLKKIIFLNLVKQNSAYAFQISIL